MTTRLSVNLNKFALLRNARGTDYPNLLEMASRAVTVGVHGITVHPRPDQRHIRYDDVFDLADFLKDYPDVEFNIEGNPVADFMKIVTRVRPHQCTLVPDSEDQLTSDHGWNLSAEQHRVAPLVERLADSGIRVSLFMDTDPEQIDLAGRIGCERIELYTGPWAEAFGTGDEAPVFKRFVDAAEEALAAGLGVNAGHDLNLDNLGKFLTIPEILEVSIGHAIVVESFDYGFEETLRRYLEIVNDER